MAEHYRTGQSPPGFTLEECNDAAEADRIATHYRTIIAKIREQQEAQS